MSEKNCVFCKIISGEIPSEFVYKDSEVVAFWDKNPKARVHLLIVPITHIKTFLDLQDNQLLVLTKLVKVVQHLIEDKNLEASYRISINGGRHQEVPHLHVHLLGE